MNNNNDLTYHSATEESKWTEANKANYMDFANRKQYKKTTLYGEDLRK